MQAEKSVLTVIKAIRHEPPCPEEKALLDAMSSVAEAQSQAFDSTSKIEFDEDVQPEPDYGEPVATQLRPGREFRKPMPHLEIVAVTPRKEDRSKLSVFSPSRERKLHNVLNTKRPQSILERVTSLFKAPEARAQAVRIQTGVANHEPGKLDLGRMERKRVVFFIKRIPVGSQNF